MDSRGTLLASGLISDCGHDRLLTCVGILTEVLVDRFTTRSFILVPPSSAFGTTRIDENRTTRQYRYVCTQLVMPISHFHKSLSHSFHKRQAPAGGWNFHLTTANQPLIYHLPQGGRRPTLTLSLSDLTTCTDAMIM